MIGATNYTVRRRNEDMNSETMQMFESSPSLWLGLRSWVAFLGSVESSARVVAWFLPSLRRFCGAGCGSGSADSSELL